MHGIGTHLGYHNTCGSVSHIDGICQLQLASHTSQQRRCYSVPCTRHIKNLYGRGRTVQHLAIIYQRHTPLATGDHNIFNLVSVLSGASHFHNCSILVIANTACGLAHFLQIGSDEVAATILAPVCTLRVNKHWNVVGVPLINHPLAKVVGAHALGVVRDNDAIQALIQKLSQPLTQLHYFLRIQIPRFFKI